MYYYSRVIPIYSHKNYSLLNVTTGTSLLDKLVVDSKFLLVFHNEVIIPLSRGSIATPKRANSSVVHIRKGPAKAASQR